MSDVQITLGGQSDAQITATVPGIQGPVGVGFPTGGTANQVLFKQSSTNYDAAWGAITSAMIGDLQIVDADVSASAAIAGTKISPNFGSQNVVTTGTSTAASFIPTSSTAPTNGLYLSAANSVALSTNGDGRLFVDASGNVGLGTGTTGNTLTFANNGSIGFAGSIAQFSTNSAYSSGADRYLLSGNEAARYYQVSGTHIWQTAPAGTAGNAVSFSERMRLDGTGRLGLGTSSPAELLDCKGNIVLGAQNAASGTLQPTSGSGTDINGSHLVLRAGRPTGSGSSGQVQICPSASSTTSGTSVRQNKTKGLYLRDQLTSWDNNVSYGMLNAVFGNSATEGNRSNLGNDGAVVTIDGANNGSQSALEIVGSSNSTNATQGFIRFFGSGSKNPYATIAATTPGVAYTSGNLQIRTYNAGVEGAVATFTDTGRVGIGDTGPTALLTIKGAAATTAHGIHLARNGYTALGRFGYQSANGSQLWLTNNYNPTSGAADSGEGGSLHLAANDFTAFVNGNQERARIDSSGRLLVGTSSSVGQGCNLQIRSDSGVNAEFIRSSDNDGGAYIALTKTRGTAGSPTEVSNNDDLGTIDFIGYDGATYRTAARIQSQADGTWTDGGDTTDNPGRLVFSTTADGAASPTERMRINSSGQVLVGTTSSTAKFHIQQDGGIKATWFGTKTASTDAAVDFFQIDYGSSIASGSFIVEISAQYFDGTTSGYVVKRYRIVKAAAGAASVTEVETANFNCNLSTSAGTDNGKVKVQFTPRSTSTNGRIRATVNVLGSSYAADTVLVASITLL